jgi:hypothetical protein
MSALLEKLVVHRHVLSSFAAGPTPIQTTPSQKNILSATPAIVPTPDIPDTAPKGVFW